MKTAMIMKRSLNGFDVRQNHKTGMLNANDLVDAANAKRQSTGDNPKLLFNYFANDAYIELEKELLWELSPDEIKLTVRGKEGGTWLHPIVFIDLAMWLSPEFRVKALKWLSDGLLIARDESGDSYKEMTSALVKHYKEDFGDTKTYIKLANKVAEACSAPRGKDRWQLASEDQLKLRDKLHKNIAFLAGISPTLQECVNTAITKTLNP